MTFMRNKQNYNLSLKFPSYIYDFYCPLRESFRWFDLMLTDEVMSGQSVILTTLFLGKPPTGTLPVLCVYSFTINDNGSSLTSRRGRMVKEIFS